MIRSRIAQLEKTLQEQASLSTETDTENSRPATMFELTLAKMDQRAASLQEELQTVTRELDALTVSIQATARNAIELDALERDFQNIQARYNEAVQNLDQARVNERIEVTAQGQRINVIENANVPRNLPVPIGVNLLPWAFWPAAGGGRFVHAA